MAIIECFDGFRVSVITGPEAYCLPRDDDGPYTHVEVGFPSERPEPWMPVDGPECWSKYVEDVYHPTQTVYTYVPKAMVDLLVKSHGGAAMIDLR